MIFHIEDLRADVARCPLAGNVSLQTRVSISETVMVLNFDFLLFSPFSCFSCFRFFFLSHMDHSHFQASSLNGDLSFFFLRTRILFCNNAAGTRGSVWNAVIPEVRFLYPYPVSKVGVQLSLCFLLSYFGSVLV